MVCHVKLWPHLSLLMKLAGLLVHVYNTHPVFNASSSGQNGA